MQNYLYSYHCGNQEEEEVQVNHNGLMLSLDYNDPELAFYGIPDSYLLQELQQQQKQEQVEEEGSCCSALPSYIPIIQDTRSTELELLLPVQDIPKELELVSPGTQQENNNYNVGLFDFNNTLFQQVPSQSATVSYGTIGGDNSNSDAQSYNFFDQLSHEVYYHPQPSSLGILEEEEIPLFSEIFVSQHKEQQCVSTIPSSSTVQLQQMNTFDKCSGSSKNTSTTTATAKTKVNTTPVSVLFTQKSTITLEPHIQVSSSNNHTVHGNSMSRSSSSSSYSQSVMTSSQSYQVTQEQSRSGSGHHKRINNKNNNKRTTGETITSQQRTTSGGREQDQYSSSVSSSSNKKRLFSQTQIAEDWVWHTCNSSTNSEKKKKSTLIPVRNIYKKKDRPYDGMTFKLTTF